MSRELSVLSATARTAITPAIWGTTYIVATEFLPDGRPMLAACVRALPVGLIFVLWSRCLPTGAWWWRSALLGMLNIGAFFALLFVAAFRLPGGVAATAGAIQPLVAAGIAAVVLGELFTRRTAMAGTAGVAGVAMLVLGPDAALDAIGVAAAIAGTLCMATGVVLTKHWGRPVDLVTFTGWQLSAGGIMLVPIVVLVEGLPASITATNVAGFAWLAVAGTGVAYANWFAGIQRLPINIISFLGLLSPLVATIVGWAVLDQTLTALQLTGAALVLTAVIAPQMPNARWPRNEPGGSRHTRACTPASHRNTQPNVNTAAVIDNSCQPAPYQHSVRCSATARDRHIFARSGARYQLVAVKLASRFLDCWGSVAEEFANSPNGVRRSVTTGSRSGAKRVRGQGWLTFGDGSVTFG